MTPPNGVQELDPGYTKSRLYSSFAWNHGWVVKYDSCGRSTAVKRTDHSWIHGDEIVTEHDDQTKLFDAPTCTNSSINNAPGEGDDKTSSNKLSNKTRGSDPDSSGKESTNTRIGTTGVNNNSSSSFTIKK